MKTFFALAVLILSGLAQADSCDIVIDKFYDSIHRDEVRFFNTSKAFSRKGYSLQYGNDSTGNENFKISGVYQDSLVIKGRELTDYRSGSWAFMGNGPHSNGCEMANSVPLYKKTGNNSAVVAIIDFTASHSETNYYCRTYGGSVEINYKAALAIAKKIKRCSKL